MIDYPKIRDALQLALAAQLGTYTFSNGLSTPAVQIDDDSAPYSESPDVEGLELVVVPNAAVAIAPTIGGMAQTLGGLLILRQHNSAFTTEVAMNIALKVLSSDFPELALSRAERLRSKNKLDTNETFSVRFSQQFLIN